MKVALTIAYNGSSYLGSQIQKETKNTIFGEFEKVLSKLGVNSKVIVSGRTDRGVHATGQVCHVDLPKFWNDLSKFKHVLNEMLPPSIEVKNVKIFYKKGDTAFYKNPTISDNMNVIAYCFSVRICNF